MKMLRKVKNRVLIALVCALALAFGLAFGLPARRTASAATQDGLADEIAKAEAGATVTLDEGFTGNIELAPTNNVTLDLGTHTITGKVTVRGMGTLTIKNGTVNGLGSGYVIENHGKLILESLTVGNSETGATASLVANKTGGTLTIKSGTYTSDFIAVKNETTSTLTIEGGDFLAEGAQSVQNWGEATIEGGTFTGVVDMLNTFEEFEKAQDVYVGDVPDGHWEYGTHLDTLEGQKLTVNGGTFKEITGWIAEAQTAFLNIGFNSNITVSAAKLENSLPKNYITEGSVLSYAEGKYVVKTGTPAFSFTDNVKVGIITKPATEAEQEAHPGIDSYEWQQSYAVSYEFENYKAVRALLTSYFAQEGHNSAVIRLIDDYTGDIVVDFSGKTVEIDGYATGHIFHGQIKVVSGSIGKLNPMNGYTFTNETAGKAVIYVENGAEMTIGGHSKIERAGNYYAIENYGKLTIGGAYNAGKYVTVTHTGSNATSSLIANKTGGEMTIDGGTFTTDFIAVKNETGSTLTIEGGTFNAEGAQSVQNWGTATLNGGTYNGIVSTLKTIEEIETAEAGGKTTITAGTYTKISGYVGVDDVAYENMAVNSQISIEGAITVKEAPYSAYVKTGWVLDIAEGGNFTVKEGTAKAEVSSSVTAFKTQDAELPEGKEWQFAVQYHFETLGTAIKYVGAHSGSINLLTSITENITLNCATTLNLNGHTLTGQGGNTVTITANSVYIQSFVAGGQIEAASGYAAIYVNEGVTYVHIGGNTSLTVVGVEDHAAIENHGSLELYGDNFVVETAGVAVENFGTLSITRGTYNGNIVVRRDGANSATLTVTRGTFKGKIFATKNGSDPSYVEGAITIAPDKSTAKYGIVFTSKENIPDVQYFTTDNLPVKSGENYVSYQGSSKSVAAYIGSVGYATLQDAVNDATNGAEIILEKDVTEDIVVNFGTLGNIKFTITIDHKLTNKTATHTVTVSGTGTLTLIGTGTVDNTAEGKAALEIENGANVVIGNAAARKIALMALDETKLSFTHSENVGPTIENAGTLEINDAEVLAANDGSDTQPIIVNKSDGTLTIENIQLGEALTGETKTTTQQAIQNWGNATLNGGDYNGQVIQCSQDGTSSSDKTLSVKGGNYAGAVYAATGSTEGGTVEKVETHEGNNGIEIAPESGKDITFSSEEIIPDKEYFGENAAPEVNEETGEVIVGDKNKAVASITIDEAGEEVEYFETLKAAIEHAQELYKDKAITIVLLKSFTEDVTIPGGVKIILDLNGFTITGTGNGVVLTVQESAELTIKSSAANGKITGSSNHYVIENHGTLTLGEKGGDDTYLAVDNEGTGPASAINNYGKLTIKSGTYTHAVKPEEEKTKSCNAVKNDNTTDEDALVIEGGTFNGVVLAYGNVKISGGTFNYNVVGGNKLEGQTDVNKTGTLTITGGTFKGMVQTYNNVVIEKGEGEAPSFKEVHIYNTGKITGGTFSGVVRVDKDATNSTTGDVTIGGTAVFSGQVQSAGKLKIEGGTFNTGIGGVVVFSDADGSITIMDGNFNAQVQSFGTLTVEGGTFTGDIVARRDGDNKGKVTVHGGEFEKKLWVYKSGSVDVSGAIVIDPSKDGITFTTADAIPAKEYFADPTDYPVANEEGGYVSGDTEHPVVAYIEGSNIGYSDLQAALAAAKAGETVVLAANVEGPITVSNTNKITLDLNGHSIIGNAKETATLTVEVGADLTIIGDAVGSKIAGGSVYYVINNEGTLTLEGENLVVENPEEGKTADTSSLVENGGTLTIEGGTYTSRTTAENDAVVDGHYNAVKNEEKATLTIKGGTFEGIVLAYSNTEISGGTFDYRVIGGNNSANPKDQTANTEGKLTITGGTFKGRVRSYNEIEIKNDDSGEGPVFENALEIYNKGTISGGTFGADGGVSIMVDTDATTETAGDVTIMGDVEIPGQVQVAGKLKIEGGKFDKDVVAMRDNGKTGSVTVTGGEFAYADDVAVWAYDGNGDKHVQINDAVSIDPDADKTVTFASEAAIPAAEYFNEEKDIPVYSDGKYVTGQSAPQASEVVATIKTAAGVEYSFTSLAEVQAHLAEGDTITLKNAAAGTLTINVDNVTLDLGTHTITGSIKVESGNSLTILGNGGTIQGAGNAYVIENYGTLTIGDEAGEHTNITVKNTVGSATASLIANKQGSTGMTIYGGTFESEFIAIKNETDAILNISGGEFGKVGHRALLNYGTANVNGGTFHGDVASILKKGDPDGDNNGVKLTITAGTFEAGIHGYTIEYAEGAWGEAEKNEPVGIIEIAPEGENQITLKEVPNAQYFKTGFVAEKEGETYKVVKGTYYAMIDGVGYASLQDALDEAVKEGKTVTLLTDVNEDVTVKEGKPVTLDLNGHTITGTGKEVTLYVEEGATLTVIGDGVGSAIIGKAGEYTIENHGTLTLGDENGKHADFTVDNAANDNKSVSTIDNRGILTVNGGTYTNNDNSPLAAIKNELDGTLTINGGEFNGQVQVYGEATINGGTFNGIVFSDNDLIVGTSDPAVGNLTVKNGTFNAKFYVFGNAQIDGGEFTQDVFAFTTDTNGKAIQSNLTIKGGTFEGNVDVVDYQNKKPQEASGMLTVSGGTINAAQAAEFASKDLALEKVVVKEGGNYVIKDKSEVSSGIYFGRSATAFDAESLYKDLETLNNSRVAYRTDNGNGDWLVVTFAEFQEIAKVNITEYYNLKLNSTEYEEAQKTELETILNHAIEHIGEINYVDGVQGVQEINTHLETAKANMDAVLNKEQAGQLQTAIDKAVTDVTGYATGLNTNFTAKHTIVAAEIAKIKAAKSQAQLEVIVEAAKSAIFAFHNAIESAVREFQLYAVSQGIDLSDENHSKCDEDYSDKIRAAKDYADITAQLNAAKTHVNSHVQEDYEASVTTRKGTAATELIAYAASLNFKTDSADNYIEALTKGLEAINAVNEKGGGTLEDVNNALAAAKENITKFYNAIENAVVLVTNYAVTNGIDVSGISDEIAAIREAKTEGETASDEGSILKGISDAKAKVDGLVAKNVQDAVAKRKTSAVDEIKAIGKDRSDTATKLNDADKKSIADLWTAAETAIKAVNEATGSLDDVNKIVNEYTAKLNLLIAKLDAIKDLDSFKTGRFTTEPAVYTSRKTNIEGATTVEQVNEYRGLALAELTDFHNALLAAEARVRSYATGKGLDLTTVVDDTTRGDAIHKKLWEAKATGEIEEKVTEAKGLVDGWFTIELNTSIKNAQDSFVSWAKGLNTHFGEMTEGPEPQTPKHQLIKAQYDVIGEATDLTDLASRLSNAQNAVQNLYNAMKNAEEAVRLYAFINGIDPDEGTHASAIATFVDEIYQAADENAVTDKLAEIKAAIDGYVTGDEQAAVSTAKGKIKEYLEEYVNDTYTPDGDTYLADDTVSKLISDAVTNIGGNKDIDTRAELEAAMLEVVAKIDTRIAIIKAVEEIDTRAKSYSINQESGSLYDTNKKAIESAQTVEAVEVARAAALVAIENFHNTIEKAVQDFETYAKDKGFDLDHDEDNCKTVYEGKLRNAKDYYDIDAVLREAEAKIDNHVASSDLAKAIEERKKSARAELKEHAESLGLTVYGVEEGNYKQSVDPYKEGITAINAASGSVEAVNAALATARANVTAFYTAIQSAVDEVTNYATSNGIEVYRIATEIAAIRAAKKEGTQDTDENSIKKTVAEAKAKVNTLVASDVAAALDARKKSAKEEVVAMGTKYNDDSVITGARTTADGEIDAAGDIDAVNKAVEKAKNAIDLQVAKLDACANLDAYVSEHFTATPEALEGYKTDIKAKENIGDVNSAYNTALAGLTSFYNSLVDAEARARSYAMTNGFDLSANVPGEEPEKTWDQYIKETVWAATKTGDVGTEGTVEYQVKTVQDKVNKAAGDALKAAITEAQSSFATWAGKLNTNFTTGHEPFDTQNTYIGEATSLTDLASRLSNAQNAMQNLYNAMKNAEEAVRLYAFINGIDPDDVDGHKTEIDALIANIMSAADEGAVSTALTAAKAAIDGYAVADEKEAVETAKKNVKTYLETYVKNTYGTTDGEKFLQDSEVSGFITGAETSIGGNEGITTAEQLETEMRKVIEKIDIRIAQIEAVEELKLHADGYKFAAGTENIEAYTKGKNAIEAADDSIEAVSAALATAKANVTAFYNAIEAAVNEFHLYAISQGIDLTKAPHDQCDKDYSEKIRKATSDDTLAQALSEAKDHVKDHVGQAVTDAVDTRKASAKAELKAHAEGLGFTINDEAIENNITAYNTGINNIDGASTIDDVNDALATAKANITTFYGKIEDAIREFEVYALRKGVNFVNFEGHTNCKATLITQLRSSKNDDELATNITAVNKHVDTHAAHNTAAALATRKESAEKEVGAMGAGRDDTKTKINGKSIEDLRGEAETTITHAGTIEEVNKAVDDAQKAIDLLIAKLDAIKEIDAYAKECGFKADSKIQAWISGTNAIEAATDLEGVNMQRELALLAIAAFRNELLNAEGEARAYATANGIDPESEKESGTTWSKYIKDTLWTATDSAQITTNLNTVKTAIHDAAGNALTAEKNKKIEEFKEWALTVDTHFGAEHKLVVAQIAILNHATSIASLNVLYDQVQSTVRSVKSAMESAISEIKTYALRNGVDITDEAHKGDIDKAIEGIYAADNETTIRSYVDQIKAHIDEHVASDQKAALAAMKEKAEEMLKDAVPDEYESDSKISGLFTTGTAALKAEGIDSIEKFNAELEKQLALLAVRVAQLDAEGELKARAEELFSRTDFVAYTSNITKIEEATSVETVEAALRTALLAVEDFYNAVENGVVLATNYAISHGVDVSEIATELQAIRTNAKNTNGQEDENSILHLVKAATDAVDAYVESNAEATLSTRQGTAKEELGTYAAERFPETYTTLEAYTNGVSAIDAAGTIEAVNDALTTAMGEIDVYYNLYLDALLDLRTHAAAHGHDLDDDDHKTILAQVTNLLNGAKNAEELGEKIDEAIAVLDDHIELHDTEVKLEEYKEDMLIELYFYALGKGVDTNDDSVQNGAKAIREVALGAVTGEPKDYDAAYNTAKAAVDEALATAKGSIDAKAAAQAIQEAKDAAVYGLKLYAATKDVEWDTAWEDAFKDASVNSELTVNAKAAEIKQAIDNLANAAAFKARKADAENELKLYAAGKDVEWKSEWSNTIGGSADDKALEDNAKSVKGLIDAAATAAAEGAAFAAKKADAEQKLKLYAATKGVSWEDEWTTEFSEADDEAALASAEATVLEEIDNMARATAAAAALDAKIADAILELKLYAASVGLPSNAPAVVAQIDIIKAQLTAEDVDDALENAKLQVSAFAEETGTSTKYLVTFIADGKVVSVQSVMSGGTAVKPDDPVVYGKVFKGWEGAFTGVTGDIVITAVFEEATNITEAKDDITKWLNDYLDELISIIDAEAEQAAYISNMAETDDALMAKLNKVYSEANAKLVKGYYDEALCYIENAESDEDVEYAVISFRNNVSAVEILEELTDRPIPAEGITTGELIALVVVAVATISVAVALVVVCTSRRRRNA